MRPRAQQQLHPADPVVDILLYLILGVAVARLDLTFELLAVAVDLGNVVVSELAPLLFGLPVSCFQLPSTRWNSLITPLPRLRVRRL